MWKPVLSLIRKVVILALTANDFNIKLRIRSLNFQFKYIIKRAQICNDLKTTIQKLYNLKVEFSYDIISC